MKLAIREATADDAPAIRSLVADTLTEFGFPVESSGVDADLIDIPGSYQSRGGIFRVVVDPAGAILGCGGLYALDEKVVELRKMYFRPSIRGQGMGKTLLDDLLVEARRRSFTRVELETASILTAALALYRRTGFVETSAARHSTRCDLTLALDLD